MTNDRYESIAERLGALEEELRDLAYERLREAARAPASTSTDRATTRLRQSSSLFRRLISSRRREYEWRSKRIFSRARSGTSLSPSSALLTSAGSILPLTRMSAKSSLS